METGYFEQHKLRLLATQLGVSRSGRYFHPPLVPGETIDLPMVADPEMAMELGERHPGRTAIVVGRLAPAERAACAAAQLESGDDGHCGHEG